MFSYTIAQEQEAARLELAGELTLENSREMSRAFKQAFEENERVCVDLSRAEKGDLSLLMLMGAARRFARPGGGELSIKVPVPGFLNDLAETAGCGLMLQDLTKQGA